jgi:hypothetical protein
MGFYDEYKPFRNYMRRFELIQGLVDVWCYSQHVLNARPLPPDYAVGKPFGVTLNRNLWPWDLDILAREIVLNAGPRGDRSLRNWNHFAEAVNHIRRLDGLAYSEPGVTESLACLAAAATSSGNCASALSNPARRANSSTIVLSMVMTPSIEPAPPLACRGGVRTLPLTCPSRTRSDATLPGAWTGTGISQLTPPSAVSARMQALGLVHRRRLGAPEEVDQRLCRDRLL